MFPDYIIYRLYLACLIYFWRFADFKLQRNKVKSRKSSFAVMENFDTEFIALLLNEENTIEEVSLILQDMYPNKRHFSMRYLKSLFCKTRNIKEDTPKYT